MTSSFLTPWKTLRSRFLVRNKGRIIEHLRGKSAKEIHHALQEVCGGTALAYNSVYRWIASFASGRVSIKDEHRSGAPVSATDAYHVQKVKEIIDSDRRMTCEDIAAEVDISVHSVHTILRQRLGMRKISARWVPHNLSEEQKHNRVQISKQLLQRYETEGDKFISRIVAIDETWIRSYEPELKRQSMQWHTPSSPRPAKFRRKQGNIKMLIIMAYDCEGILATHRIPEGSTINKECYKDFLQNHLRVSIRKKRPKLLESGPLVLHDNASCHKAGVVTSLLHEYKWEVLPHPPYSPDMSPPDYDLFPKLKEPFRGIRYDDLDELYGAVIAEVRRMNKRCLATGVRVLPKRWQSVIDHRGGYIEGS